VSHSTSANTRQPGTVTGATDDGTKAIDRQYSATGAQGDGYNPNAYASIPAEQTTGLNVAEYDEDGQDFPDFQDAMNQSKSLAFNPGYQSHYGTGYEVGEQSTEGRCVDAPR
jgi:hypothetical protein